MNRQTLLDLDALVGQSVTVTLPGEVLTDVDGTPTAVTTSYTTDAALFGVYVSLAEVRAAGLAPADVPHLTVIDLDREEQDHG